MTHECPACGGDCKISGYRCDMCDGLGYVDDQTMVEWMDFQESIEQQRYEAERQ